jgi:hypothetical protein
MRWLAALPARRLWTLVAAVCVLALGAGIAQAALRSGGGAPPPKPLDRAVRDALAAPPAPGISARIELVDHLLPSGSMAGQGASSPLLTGASGRLWLTRDGRFRLELQSGSGDAQVVSDGRTLTVYDAGSNTVYRAALPASAAGERRERGERGERRTGPPTLAAVRRGLGRLARAWTLSGARPTRTAGRPSYTVRIAPKDRGGLLGAGELAWDAVRGVPLRAAVYARGQTSPVLALRATDIAYRAIPDSDVRAPAPPGAKVVRLNLSRALAQARGAHSRGRQSDGTVTVHGRGLGAIAVLERPVTGTPAGGRDSLGQLPRVALGGGTTGRELATALGTVITFERAGVSYTVAGSVPPAAAERVARGVR